MGNEKSILGASYLDEIEKLSSTLLLKDKEIKDKELFLDELLDLIPAAVFYRDLSGVYLGCNKAYAQIHDRCCDDIIGHNMSELYSKEDFDMLCEAQAEMLKGKTVTETRTLTIKNTEKTFVFQRRCYPESDGDYVGVIGVAIDITGHPECEFIKMQEGVSDTCQTQ